MAAGETFYFGAYRNALEAKEACLMRISPCFFDAISTVSVHHTRERNAIFHADGKRNCSCDASTPKMFLRSSTHSSSRSTFLHRHRRLQHAVHHGEFPRGRKGHGMHHHQCRRCRSRSHIRELGSVPTCGPFRNHQWRE